MNDDDGPKNTPAAAIVQGKAEDEGGGMTAEVMREGGRMRDEG